MAQEMTSFVLRFVREVSEEQEARWRGLIQHVQSGAERNFATFADAVQFMQGRVLENTLGTSEEEEVMEAKSPFAEMAKMWGDLGPQMVGMWTQTAERVMDQSSEFRSQVDQAVTAALETWGVPAPTNQESVMSGFVQLNAQIVTLMARVEALEEQLATIQKKQEPDERSEDESPESEK